MAAFVPTAQQLVLAWFAACALLGIAFVLALVWAVLDYGVDRIVAWWQQRQRSRLADAWERRRLNAIVTGRVIH